MDGEKIIRWQRKRSGKAEEIHHILKDELGGGHVPSKRFGSNAAWWTITVLALKIHNLLKHGGEPEAARILDVSNRCSPRLMGE